MSDALTSNEADAPPLIRCHCLAHGRRKFSELEDVLPAECQVVIDALTQVFDHEDTAAEQQRSARECFAYHQACSGPIMEGLQRWLAQQCDERLVEPDSSLGKAISSLWGHWETLTQFFSVPGAPLDHNTVERALKRFIRQRKNALGPPGEAPLREALGTEPEALAIIPQELERRASAIAEDKDRPAEGIVRSHLTAHGRESIDPCAEIDGLRGEQEATWGGELAHEGLSKKVRTTAVRRS